MYFVNVMIAAEKSRPLLILSVLVWGTLVSGLDLEADTLHVDLKGGQDFTTIQAAMDSASSGDTILVNPGRYFGQINFSGKDVHLQSSKGPEMTIIDARPLERSCILFVDGEGRDAVVEGFTITEGRGEPGNGNVYARRGGGFYIDGASPTIRKNIITFNFASGSGAGIYARGIHEDGGPFIVDNEITGNWTRNVTQSSGHAGGLALTAGAVVIGNNISDNLSEGNGAGIWVSETRQQSYEISGNVISGNHSRRGSGGGIYIANSGGSVRFHRNILWKNSAEGRGARGNGASLWVSGRAEVTENSIAGVDVEVRENTETWSNIVISKGSVEFKRNIVALSQYDFGIYCYEQLQADIRDNIFWETSAIISGGSCLGIENENGNQVADPWFCGETFGDLRVAANSPALSHMGGTIGAFGYPGCSAVTTLPVSWGRIKLRFRDNTR